MKRGYYYVGAILDHTQGSIHRTEADAIAHAERLLARDGLTHKYIVKIVGVVEKTPPAPPPTRFRRLD